MTKCPYRLRVALFFFMGLSIFTFGLPLNVRAGSIPEASSPRMDCEGTIDAWVSSGYYRPGDCRCDSNGQPVCGQGSVSGSSSDDRQRNGGSRGIFGWIDYLQQKAAARAEERRKEGLKQNAQGVKAFNRHDYTEALRLFRQAADNDGNNATIRQNLKNTEAALAQLRQEKLGRQEAQRKAESFRQQSAKYVALMPSVKTLPEPAPSVHVPAGDQIPMPGFSEAAWQQYLEAQRTVKRLYVRLNRDGVLSDADAKTFYAALQLRNRLWTEAEEQPLSAKQRDRLLLPLPVAIDTSLMNLPAMLKQLHLEGQAGSATDSDRNNATSGAPSQSATAAVTTLVSDFSADKATDLFSGKVGEALEEAGGETLKNRYEKLVGLARVAVSARQGGAAQAGAQTADFMISQMPEPLSDRAGQALQGGRLYSKVACRALNRFMVDAMKATGSDFDVKAFWKRFDASLDTSQKGEKAWIQFCE